MYLRVLHDDYKPKVLEEVRRVEDNSAAHPAEEVLHSVHHKKVEEDLKTKNVEDLPNDEADPKEAHRSTDARIRNHEEVEKMTKGVRRKPAPHRKAEEDLHRKEEVHREIRSDGDAKKDKEMIRMEEAEDDLRKTEEEEAEHSLHLQRQTIRFFSLP